MSRHVRLAASFVLSISLLCALPSSHIAASEPTEADLEFVEMQIRPLLAESCLKCHGDENELKGKLRLDSVKAWSRGGDTGPALVQHTDLPKHSKHALAVDRPIACLLADLKQRGLFDETLIIWGGEFGRTIYSQGGLSKQNYGRDHHPRCFTVWLAGGGFKPSYAHGATDDYGHKGIAGKVHMHDLHATILHQLGLDHKRLTYNYAGRNFRLTDVHGEIVQEIVS